eukprot:Hpha_TRINITY_DN23571_c0_g1::TRINITY_DN23571_c0_g1_i1::g.186366::m.186366
MTEGVRMEMRNRSYKEAPAWRSSERSSASVRSISADQPLPSRPWKLGSTDYAENGSRQAVSPWGERASATDLAPSSANGSRAPLWSPEHAPSAGQRTNSSSWEPPGGQKPGRGVQRRPWQPPGSPLQRPSHTTHSGSNVRSHSEVSGAGVRMRPRAHHEDSRQVLPGPEAGSRIRSSSAFSEVLRERDAARMNGQHVPPYQHPKSPAKRQAGVTVRSISATHAPVKVRSFSEVPVGEKDGVLARTLPRDQRWTAAIVSADKRRGSIPTTKGTDSPAVLWRQTSPFWSPPTLPVDLTTNGHSKTNGHSRTNGPSSSVVSSGLTSVAAAASRHRYPSTLQVSVQDFCVRRPEGSGPFQWLVTVTDMTTQTELLSTEPQAGRLQDMDLEAGMSEYQISFDDASFRLPVKITPQGKLDPKCSLSFGLIEYHLQRQHFSVVATSTVVLEDFTVRRKIGKVPLGELASCNVDICFPRTASASVDRSTVVSPIKHSAIRSPSTVSGGPDESRLHSRGDPDTSRTKWSNIRASQQEYPPRTRQRSHSRGEGPRTSPLLSPLPVDPVTRRPRQVHGQSPVRESLYPEASRVKNGAGPQEQETQRLQCGTPDGDCVIS